MQRTFSALTVAVLGAGLAIVGAAAPASATDANPSASADISASCISLDVNLSGFSTDPGAPAKTEQRVVTPAVAEVSHTDYVYKKVLGFGPSTHVSHKWAGDDLGYDLSWYHYTGKSSKHVEVPAKPAVTETVVVSEAVPANPTPNTVTVQVDGEVVADHVAFGEAFVQGFVLDKYTEQAYTVTVTSFDGEGAGEWTGTSPACAVGDWKPTATIASQCGSALVTVTNPALAADAINKTYAAVVYVDGTATDFIASFENGTETRSYTFPEDSGVHTVVVRTGPAQGDTMLATATVSSDCVENPEPVDPVDPTLNVEGDFVAGGAIAVDGAKFEPNTEYAVELHSPVQALGTITTDGDGAFTLPATIPGSTPAGAHHVVVLLDGAQKASIELNVSAAPVVTPPADNGSTPATPSGTGNAGTAPAATSTSAGLAETGVETTTVVLIALALFALGGAAFVGTRVVRSRA